MEQTNEVTNIKVMVLYPEYRSEVIPYPGTELEDWQKLVGGLIEQVHIADEAVLIVNEEGMLMGLAYNELASAMAGKTIVGPAVVLNGKALELWLSDV